MVHQTRVVGKVYNAIHRINHYPAVSVVCFVNTYPLVWIATYPVDSLIQPSNNWGQLGLHGVLWKLSVKYSSQEFLILFGLSYFGLKYYGQCWSGATAGKTYSRDGPAESCVKGVGVESTFFVYKFYDYSYQGKAQPRSQSPLSSLEKVSWLRLVTCLLDFSRFQRCDWREGLKS